MVKRLHGLAILATALAPAILLIVVGLATWAAVSSVRSAALDYGAYVDGEVRSVTAAFDEAGAAFDDVGRFVSGIASDVTTAVEGLGSIGPDVHLPVEAVRIPRTLLADLPTVARIDLDPFPDFPGYNPPDVYLPEIIVLEANALDFTIPGVEPLGQFLVDASAVSRSIGADIEDELGHLVTVPAPISNVAGATAELGANVRATFRTWLIVVAITLAVMVAAWITTSIGSVMFEVRRGWAMLLGRPAEIVSVDDLRAQIRAIEANLARLT